MPEVFEADRLERSSGLVAGDRVIVVVFAQDCADPATICHPAKALVDGVRGRLEDFA